MAPGKAREIQAAGGKLGVLLPGMGAVARTVIAGVGNAQAELVSAVKRFGLSEKDSFRGWLDRHSLEDLYRETKIVVVPSRWPEPFGMIGLEAMSHAAASPGARPA